MRGRAAAPARGGVAPWRAGAPLRRAAALSLAILATAGSSAAAGETAPRPALLLLAGAAATQAAAAAGETAPRPALVLLADAAATQAAALAPPERTVMALAVEAPPAPALGAAFDVALSEALHRAGYRGVLAAEGRAGAAALGADAFLHVTVALDGVEVAAAGELVGVRENFFTGAAAIGAGGLVSARAPADRDARLLALAGAPSRIPGSFALEVRRYHGLSEPPLALALGDLDGDRIAEVAVLTGVALYVLSGGKELTRRELPRGEGATPARDPAAALVIHDGLLSWALPSLGSGELLALVGGQLQQRQPLAEGALPLAAGAGGVLSGLPLAGRNSFGPALRHQVRLGARGPRAATLPAPIFSAAAAASAAAVPFGVVTTGYRFLPLREDLSAAAPAVEGVGAAAALADLDGDGQPELVASGTGDELPDRIRILRIGPGAGASVVAESQDLPALLLAAAAGDLDGDGLEEAVLGGRAAGERGAGVLYLVRRKP